MSFRKRKLVKRLAAIGSSIDTAYILYVNNLDPIHFQTQQDAFNYLQEFRNENEIFKLQIYRVETFSL